MKIHTDKFLRQRKLLMALPLLALPFVTLAFWALGGGRGNEAIHSSKSQEGFNATLPDARPRADNLDKMSLYNQAMQDSLARAQARELDPYADSFASEPVSHLKTYGLTDETGSLAPRDHSWQSDADPNEAKITAKLAALQKAIDGAPGDTAIVDTGQPNNMITELEAGSSNTNQLEKMMQSLNASGEENDDPEMQQLNGMLDKILDIQHPQRLQDELQKASLKQQGRVFPVTVSGEDRGVALFPVPGQSLPKDTSSQPVTVADAPQEAFYDLEGGHASASKHDRAITAAIQETETVTSGATVKMRLQQDIYVNGMLIPKDQFIYGTATLQGERLKIAITGIHYGNSIFPVSLSVYDMDGMEGIHIPGAATRDAAKEGASQAVQSLQLMSLDPSLTAQAAGAGMEAVKGLLGKKAKMVRVTVKAGYPILLVDQKDQGL